MNTDIVVIQPERCGASMSQSLPVERCGEVATYGLKYQSPIGRCDRHARGSRWLPLGPERDALVLAGHARTVAAEARAEDRAAMREEAE